MLTRVELKTRAKEFVKKYYWHSVLAGIILVLAGGVSIGKITQQYQDGDSLPVVLTAMLFLAAVICVVFVCYPLQYSATSWFLEVAEMGEKEDSSFIKPGFEPQNYMRSVETIFFKNLFIFLWGLLFFFPGAVKHYQYYFVTQILHDHPDLSGKEVLEYSRAMTNGYKMDLFVLDISFFLWILLSAITCGAVGVFYYVPYYSATVTQKYMDLKNTVRM